MGFLAGALPYIGAAASVGSAAAPLFIDPDKPNQQNMSQPQSSRNVRMPQGLMGQQQQQAPDQTMMMLFSLMQALSQMSQGGQVGQSSQQPGSMPQPGLGPPPGIANGITPGPSQTGIY